MEEELQEEQLIKEALELCISRPFNIEAFAMLHNMLEWDELPARRRNERLGVIDFSFSWLRDENLTHAIIRDRLWDWLQAFVIIDDLDDENELEPIRAFVSRGGIELAAQEIDDPDCIFREALLSILSWCCMVPEYIPRVMSTGIHKMAIRFVNEDPEEDTAEISMSLLRALSSLGGPLRDCLLHDGLLECVRVYIRDLHSPANDVRLRRAFRAASIITRLADRDKSGRGKRMLLRHPRIITLTLDMLDRVLTVGSRGTVLNMSIDPHLITMDLLLVSGDRDFREHFNHAIPILLKALELRGVKNPLMTQDVMGILLDLANDARFLEEMQRQPTRETLSRALERFLTLGNSLYSAQTISMASRLQGLVDITRYLSSTFRASPPPFPDASMIRKISLRVAEEEDDEGDDDAEDVSISEDDDMDLDSEVEVDEGEGDLPPPLEFTIRVVDLSDLERDEELARQERREGSTPILVEEDIAPVSLATSIDTNTSAQTEGSDIRTDVAVVQEDKASSNERLNVRASFQDRINTPRLAMGLAVFALGLSLIARRY